MRVRELLYREGFTIAGARKKLQRTGQAPDESSADGSSGEGAKTREQLLAMRLEIEAFLAELDAKRS
jgi:hypothetical protein